MNRPTWTGLADDFFGRLALSPDTGTLAALFDEYAQTQGELPRQQPPLCASPYSPRERR
ncbi:hypothetical protein [Streptomyces kaempferi]|uniref:Uncharacterized protein n=1 Tax=Streptomyces kaempferi TaxID=333725 RepID=A0ABW3XQZ7_9ACTN